MSAENVDDVAPRLPSRDVNAGGNNGRHETWLRVLPLVQNRFGWSSLSRTAGHPDWGRGGDERTRGAPRLSPLAADPHAKPARTTNPPSQHGLARALALLLASRVSSLAAFAQQSTFGRAIFFCTSVSPSTLFIPR